MSLTDIRKRIAKAADVTGRPEPQLVAVSKVQPVERVIAGLDQGQRVFGENRVQEAAGKWPDLRASYSGVELHLIGPLQTNKLRQALDLFDVIQSVDRMKLAQKLAAEVQARGACPDLYIQVNTGEEAQKSGVLPADTDTFVAQCREDLDLPIKGLMVIPPVDDDPALHFARLATIAERNGLTGLSMGMSGDFETAIAHGATVVRIGSAVFGTRGL